MTRKDYYQDPQAPQATTLLPATSAIVLNQQSEILLQQRRDNQLWALPGGAMTPGESVAQCLIREVREETGLIIQPDYLVGIYADPDHVIAYSDGEVRQEFSLCFFCSLIDGAITVSDESLTVGFFSFEDVEHLDMHPSIRLRIQHFREHRKHPFFS